MEYLGKPNKKIIIIISMILLVGIISLIVYMLTKEKEEELPENVISEEETNTNIDNSWKQTFHEIENYNIYYSVKGILNNYIKMIKEANGDEYIAFSRLKQSKEEAIAGLQQEATTAILEMYDDIYIENANINEEKILENAQQYKQQGDYSKNMAYNLKIKEMYLGELSQTVNLIFVNFEINGIEDNMLIKLDVQNRTYSIFGREYIDEKGYSTTTAIEDIEIDSQPVESNNYNTFDYIQADEKYIVNQYFSEYQSQLLNNRQFAYQLLNDEYREKKYENQEEFDQYIEQNYESMQSMYLSEYQVHEFDEYKEYVCLDQNNRYYIFLEKSITDYSVLLDTYTIDLKDFTDKYNGASTSMKVGMNAEKILSAINDKDYRYVYNKLDENFRNNTFGNLENFGVYMNDHFYNQNDIEYTDFTEEGNIYIYNATLKNAQDTEAEGKKLTIIMQLLEGTDFVMSFSLE